MARYLVERYLPGMTEHEVAAATARLRAAAGALAGRGEELTYLGSTYVPEEEACFCQFEAASADAVARVSAIACLPFARITAAHGFPDADKEGACGQLD